MITQIMGSFGLSQYWTYKDICSEILVLTNTADNERVQLSNVRTHVKTAMSYVVNLLNLAEAPWYNVFMLAKTDGIHPTGLGYVNLDSSSLQTPLTVTLINNPSRTIVFNPALQLNMIKRVSFWPVLTTTAVQAALQNLPTNTPNQELNNIFSIISQAASLIVPFKGNVSKRDLSELVQLNTAQNTQWYHSVTWTHSGQHLLLHYGDEIFDPVASDIITKVLGNSTNNRISYFINTNENIKIGETTIPLPVTHNLVITATRKPLLDDMLPPESSLTYNSLIDLPDEYADLVIKLGQKKVLEQLNQIVPQQLEMEINQGLATINAQLQNDIQLEMSEREKRKYGMQQRPPGSI